MRNGLRSTVVGAAVVAVAAVPSTMSAQSWLFNSCSTAGVCGSVEASFAASMLNVRVSNLDNIVGSALYTVQLVFAAALNPATPGAAFTPVTTASLGGATSSIGTTPANAWSFGGLGGSNVLDLSQFFGNVFVEGTAASPFRALPGDPDNGTWVTDNGYVQFTANMSGVSGLAGNSITNMGFCTDVGCALGQAVVPEPASLALMAIGLVGVAGVRWRRKNSVA